MCVYDQIVSDPEDIYCVILHALPAGPARQSSMPASSDDDERLQLGAGGAAHSGTTCESSPPQRDVSTASSSMLVGHVDPRQNRTVLFSGYVNYGQVSSHIQQSGQVQLRSLFGGLFGGPSSSRERILMIGPGGVGQAEVAVKTMRGNMSSEAAAEASEMPFDTYLKMYQEAQKDIKNLAQQGK